MTHRSDRSLSVAGLARVEGEGAMHVRVDGGIVTDVRLEIYEPPRFFEALLQGRAYTEAPDITARICGICPVAYQMSACRAIEDACGVTVDGALADLRRLLYCGEWIESHALHIYLLHAPDFLGYDGVVEMARDHRGVVERGLSIKKAGNELLTLLGGRAIHPVNVRVGGFYRVPTRAELDTLTEPLRRYAYPPNALGYCGPSDHAALLGYATGQVSDSGLVDLAGRFTGAWPYLTLIAAANARTDPLDAAVVEAYWIGSPLLERVPAGLLANQLEDRFRHQIGSGFAELAQLAVCGGRAHHNFHVFCVYPWVGLLRAGHVEDPLRVLNSCRIRWGTITSIHNGYAVVSTQPLRWTGRELALAAAGPEQVTLATTAGRLAPRVRVGDIVSLHWGWICDVLTASQAGTLRRYTLGQLRVANHTVSRPVADKALR
jgi:hypothetical protein